MARTSCGWTRSTRPCAASRDSCRFGPCQGWSVVTTHTYMHTHIHTCIPCMHACMHTCTHRSMPRLECGELQTYIHAHTGELRSVLFRFRSAAELHAWMYSTEREENLRQLGPLLHAPTEVSANASRTLPDSFSDMLIPANGSAPLRPPPKWKVVLLTTCSLWLVVYPTSLWMPSWLLDIGVTDP